MCNFLNFEKNKTINIQYVSRIFYIVILQLSIVVRYSLLISH